MSIEKKSLISALKTTKKANVASTPVQGEKAVSSKAIHAKAVSSKAVSSKAVSSKALGTRAVSAPAPPTTPRNQGGKLLRTSVKSDRSPLGKPGTTNTAVKPAKKTKARVRV